MEYSSQQKIKCCNRLHNDWQKLADYFAIPTGDRKAFEKGREPHGVWEWLEVRDKLNELRQALSESEIDRQDIIDDVLSSANDAEKTLAPATLACLVNRPEQLFTHVIEELSDSPVPVKACLYSYKTSLDDRPDAVSEALALRLSSAQPRRPDDLFEKYIQKLNKVEHPTLDKAALFSSDYDQFAAECNHQLLGYLCPDESRIQQSRTAEEKQHLILESMTDSKPLILFASPFREYRGNFLQQLRFHFSEQKRIRQFQQFITRWNQQWQAESTKIWLKQQDIKPIKPVLLLFFIPYQQLAKLCCCSLQGIYDDNIRDWITLLHNQKPVTALALPDRVEDQYKQWQYTLLSRIEQSQSAPYPITYHQFHEHCGKLTPIHILRQD